MTPARLREIRAWHVANQRAVGRSALRCAAGCDGCLVCHVDTLLREVDRLTEWLDVATADENANAKDLRAALDAAETEHAAVLAWLRRPHHEACDWVRRPAGSPACNCAQWLVDERADQIAAGKHRVSR